MTRLRQIAGLTTSQLHPGIIVGLYPVGHGVAEIHQRISDGSQLPVQQRDDIQRGIVEDQVVEPVVTVNEAGPHVNRLVAIEPAHDRFKVGHVVSSCCAIPTGPAGDLSADITGALTPAQSLTRFQQDDPVCVYEGSWQTGYTNWYYASGGSLVSTDTEDSSVTITFEGNYAILISKTTPWYGIADVSLDGGEAVEVDFWSSKQKYKQRIYSTGILSPGEHTLTISWTPEKNPSSWGTTIGLDAVDVLLTAE